MATKKGIDVSTHQGTINWDKVKGNIDFAIIRAGCGKNIIDSQFHNNAAACSRLGIPFGVYWFSYAYTEAMAKAEADYVCNAAAKYKLAYPICFDFEYDSYNYAVKNGVTPTKGLLVKMATAFLNRVEERGYYAMNYTNLDYLSRGFSGITDKYDTWLAQWGVSSPSRSCGIWQYSSAGNVPGISGNVDMDYAYKDYPSIIATMGTSSNDTVNGTTNDKTKEEQLGNLKNEMWGKYYSIAKEVLDGKWGNGDARKNKLTGAGYDYNFVQSIVNIIV